jgi:hypothetical protein
MTTRRLPILPAVALLLATYIGGSWIVPAAEQLRGAGQTIDTTTTDTYNEEK